MATPHLQYDVVIIGAGICGALAATELAPFGRVLILEAGPESADRTLLVGNYAAAADKHPGSPYADAEGDKYAPTPDNDKTYYVKGGALPFKSTYVRRVGGSTWHFLGNTPRFIPADFELKSRYKRGENWPLTYADLEEDYVLAERAMGVSGDHVQLQDLLGARRSQPFPMTHVWESYGDRVMARYLNEFVLDGVKVRLLSTPQARNSRPYDGRPACAGNSTCVPICPIQAKYDGTVHVRKAQAAGVELRHRAVVFRLEENGDGTIGQVHYRTWDGVDYLVQGRVVILAAHAIESAKLLLLSGLATSSKQVGCNLMDHLQGAVVCLAPEPVYGFRGPPTTSGVDAFRDGPFRRERAAFRLSLGNDGWGRTATPEAVLKEFVGAGIIGRKLREQAEWRFIRQLRLSFSTEMLPQECNRIELDPTGTDALGLPKPRHFFQMDDYSRAAISYAESACQKIFNHCGATEIKVAPVSDGFSGAGHIMGTTRMGQTRGNSVVNSHGQAHEHPNLYIVGASVFPTSGTANPTLTAAALTFRSTRAIAAALAPEKLVVT